MKITEPRCDLIESFAHSPPRGAIPNNSSHEDLAISAQRIGGMANAAGGMSIVMGYEPDRAWLQKTTLAFV